MSPVRYELGFYIPEDDILHSYRRENLKPFMILYGSFPLCVKVTMNNKYKRETLK
jgi:hypothetical protein